MLSHALTSYAKTTSNIVDVGFGRNVNCAQLINRSPKCALAWRADNFGTAQSRCGGLLHRCRTKQMKHRHREERDQLLWRHLQMGNDFIIQEKNTNSILLKGKRTLSWDKAAVAQERWSRNNHSVMFGCASRICRRADMRSITSKRISHWFGGEK